MKIRKFIDVQAEVEVNVSSEEIAAHLATDPQGSVRDVLTGFNNIAAFVKAIPDSTFSGMNDLQRTLICGFFEEQGRRIAKIGDKQ